ncbi:M48 family metallopeptidase [Patescibacteria group bacterium]|nr:M48 family metallopeptidase [Patescibacteria group bacterium]MBU4162392.1 M48 family metallopeptidase [Patescibacteria group bacterium]
MTSYNVAESNVRKTWLLLTVFLILVIGVGWIFSYVMESPGILYFAVGFSIFMSFSSYWYSDKIVLSLAGAKLIEKSDNPTLYRIVENLCITAGLPFPKVYIINESQPNAFATGRNKKHAVVAVTQGLLEKLEKSELEGVIAHELSHIKNKDMLLQTMVVVLVGIIALVSNMFLRMGFLGRGRRDSRGGVGAILAILGIVSAILAPIAANLIKLAISRKREFLADANGALITRYPEGLAKALEKIAQDPSPLRKANSATAHLYISNPFRGEKSQGWFTRLFMTHPPTEERIKALMGLKI